jgi:hypothetical protein
MKRQKVITRSNTVWSALITLTIAVLPYLQQGMRTNFEQFEWSYVISVTISTLATIIARYNAETEIYTPHGLPGRDYKSVTNQASYSDEHGSHDN